MFDLEYNIRSWSDHLRSRGKLKECDLVEVESHLRDEVEDLTNSGLTEEEAFIISVKRFGNLNDISGEYSKLNMTAFWKQLITDHSDRISEEENRRKITLVIVFSLIAGTLAKIPELFGYNLFDLKSSIFYLKNLSFFILPFVALYFLLTRKSKRKYYYITLSVFILSAIIVNLFPILFPSDTALLTGIHLPILMWMIVGVAYMGGNWQNSKSWMDFLRFTGETFIYGVLISCGVVALGLFVQVIFETIKINLSWFIERYVFVYGECAAMMVAVYLVEAKKSVVENFAPVLAKIFSPLFLISMIAYLVAMIVTGKSIYTERNFLIGFDLMLVLVLGLVLYVISARGINDPPNLFDYLNLSLIVTALILNLVALSAIVYRLNAFGVSPNKIAAFGENVILMINLAGLAKRYFVFFKGKAEFDLLEKWQTSYLYVYAAWFAFVAFIFPPVFGFR